MPGLLLGLSEKFKGLSTHGVVYSTISSLLLYVCGYLALRFHLTALGIGTDLAVFDERYLFAGAQFLTYLCTAVPSLVLVILLPGGVLYGAYLVLPAGARAASCARIDAMKTWVTQPTRLLLVGIVFSVCMIQFFMRDCFELNNLLLKSSLPKSSLLAVVHLDDWLSRENEGRVTLFFLGLVAGCAISGLMVLALRQRPPASDSLVLTRYLFYFLAAAQFLLLPINYGYLVLDKSLPKVASLDGSTSLAAETEAWLVWEGREGMTYLVREQGTPETRKLITLPRDQVKRIEIIGYDRMFSKKLFAPRKEAAP